MFSKLNQVSETVVQQVEDVSGSPVHVRANSNLDKMANMRIARAPESPHLVEFNPSAAPRPEYLICYQCGFILRLYQRSPEKQLTFGGTEAGRKAVSRLVSKEKSLRKLPVSSRRQLTKQLFGGLMTQLRSVPIGLRVDDWIRDTYPELCDLQEDAARRQIDENEQAAAPKVQKMMPEKICNANLGINAAFADYWAGILEEPPLRTPYRAAGCIRIGQKLRKIWKDIPSTPDHDIELVDRWAEELDVTGWYTWIPREDSD